MIQYIDAVVGALARATSYVQSARPKGYVSSPTSIKQDCHFVIERLADMAEQVLAIICLSILACLM
jgi:hypothetical protein